MSDFESEDTGSIPVTPADIDRKGILITTREGNYIRISVVYTPWEVQPWYESITRVVSGQAGNLLCGGSIPLLATNMAL